MILQKRFTNHKPLNNSGYAEQTKEQEKKCIVHPSYCQNTVNY